MTEPPAPRRLLCLAKSADASGVECLCPRLRDLRLDGLFRVDRELQHGRRLAFAQARHKHELAAREFQRVVMIVRVLEIDLAEARDLVGDLAARQQAEGVTAGNFVLEWGL